MTGPGEPETDWSSFLATLAEVLPHPAELERDTRLIEDLSLDSLALAELAVVLIEEYDPAGLWRQLDDRTWEAVTLGMLFQECTRSFPDSGSRRSSSTV